MPGIANWHALCRAWIVTCVVLDMTPQKVADLAGAAGESEAGLGTSSLDSQPVRDPPLRGSARAPRDPHDGGHRWNRSWARCEPGFRFWIVKDGTRYEEHKKALSESPQVGESGLVATPNVTYFPSGKTLTLAEFVYVPTGWNVSGWMHLLRVDTELSWYQWLLEWLWLGLRSLRAVTPLLCEAVFTPGGNVWIWIGRTLCGLSLIHI